MRVSESQSSSAESRMERKNQSQAEKSKNFSKVLARRNGEFSKNETSSLPDTSRKSKKPLGEAKSLKKILQPSDKADSTVPIPMNLQQTSAAIQRIETPRESAEPSRIHKLVQEIWLGINSKGQHEVQIQLNSSTFEGLRIQINKQEAEISIKILGRSNEVLQTLTQNINALSQALTAHGIHVSKIEIQNGFGPSWREQRKRPGRDRQGGRHGRQ